MTLITAVLTPHWIALGADRRLTWRDARGRVTKQTDADTKIAVIEGEMLVGYTGVVPATQPGGFGDWIGDLMSTLTAGPITSFLQRRLTDHWASTPGLSGQAFMLVTIGFTSSGLGTAQHPQIVTISNAMNSDGDFSPYVPVSKTFGVRMHPTPTNGYLVMTQGYYRDVSDLEEFTIEGSGHELNAVLGDRVATEVYKLHHVAAAESGGLVGSATLIVFMSRAAFRSTAVAMNIGGDIVISTGGGFGAGPDGGGPVNYEREIVAQFADPTGVVTDKYAPAQIPTGRPSGARYMRMSGIRSGRGDTFFPEPLGLTDDSPHS